MKYYGFQIDYNPQSKGIIKFFKKIEDYLGVVQALDDGKYYLVYEDNEIGRALVLLVYSKYEEEKPFRVLEDSQVSIVREPKPLDPELIAILNEARATIKLYYSHKNPHYIFYKLLVDSKKFDDTTLLGLKKLIMLTITNKEFIEDYISVLEDKLDIEDFVRKYSNTILKGVFDEEALLKVLKASIKVKIYLGRKIAVSILDRDVLVLDAKRILSYKETKDGKKVKIPFLTIFDVAKILSVLEPQIESLEDLEQLIKYSEDLRAKIEDLIRAKVFHEAFKGNILLFENEQEEEAVQSFIFQLTVQYAERIIKLKSYDSISKFSPRYIFIVREIMVVPSTVLRFMNYPRKLIRFLDRINALLTRRRVTFANNKRVWAIFLDLNILKKYFRELQKLDEIAKTEEEALNEEYEHKETENFEKIDEILKKHIEEEEIEVEPADGLPKDFLEK